jgi:hypothetical protein
MEWEELPWFWGREDVATGGEGLVVITGLNLN